LKLLRATPPPTDRRDAGFTIIEVLVALALVAVSILAIGSVMSTNVRGVRTLEQHVTLMQTVRSIMSAEVGTKAGLGFGETSGKVNDYRWKVDVGPLGEEWTVNGPDSVWTPALVTIEVRSPSGAVSELKTVRLIRGSAR
jgi:general secretion pathway protein I